MKRKHAGQERAGSVKSTPRKRRKSNRADHIEPREESTDEITVDQDLIVTPRRQESRGSRSLKARAQAEYGNKEPGSPIPRANQEAVVTPIKDKRGAGKNGTTPSKSKRADRSAKRKSARALHEIQEEDDWAGETALAQAILDDDNDELGEDAADIEASRTDFDLDEAISGLSSEPTTPSKRGKGRPKGSKNKRSPTPEGDIAPEERYFFQNRPGPSQVSSRSVSKLKLLDLEEYYNQARQYKDPHEHDKAYLYRLHKRSFPQWIFELSQSFSICLYGYGSKRGLVTDFAQYLCKHGTVMPKIVIVNGYISRLNVRTILSTVATAALGSEAPMRLGAQPSEVLETLVSQLSTSPDEGPIYVFINSVDAPHLRKPSVQALLARLAASSFIRLLTTTDTPHFPLMWDSSLRAQFNFVFHDCTTFVPYVAELNVVDDVHDLLGHKGRRVGGKEGIAFVLQSLPENARNLYRILVSEILTILAEGMEDNDLDDEDPLSGKKTPAADREAGVEHKMLYQKAVEEFICSSEMAFRTLLKEFQDHQMVVSRKDAAGTETLGVPLAREELEGVLEDLMGGG